MVQVFKQLLPVVFSSYNAAEQWLADNPQSDSDRYEYLVVQCWLGVPNYNNGYRKPDAHTSYRIRRYPRR